MSKPVVVSIPHHLGKEVALARLKSGLTRASFGNVLKFEEGVWAGDHLQFRLRVMGQAADGTIDVAEEHVRIEVMLPWLLAAFAERVAPVIRKEGTLLLEKK